MASCYRMLHRGAAAAAGLEDKWASVDECWVLGALYIIDRLLRSRRTAELRCAQLQAWHSWVMAPNVLLLAAWVVGIINHDGSV